MKAIQSKYDIKTAKSVVAPFLDFSNGDSDCGITNSERRTLKKLSKSNPLKTINLAIGHYSEWDNCEYEAFPFDHRNDRYFTPGIAGDGIGDDPCANINDRQPTDEFKELFKNPNPSSGYFDIRAYYIQKCDATSKRRDILVALGDIGLRPCSMDWLDGAVHRCLGIPRLGRRGGWGRGWLFANAFKGWEGAKSKIGSFLTSNLLSPSEWKWILEQGLAVEPWSQHVGCPEWDWSAL